ncbi:hypothetical protein QJS04_geneDACA002017 [Acorus gramineus]|uniref:F-box domain-containing protein n=1 Tax=Acorus gramineus TaxID=55184 RepID=A0AAV9A834_ACOGR|nr:hypothetical protein QJS04_geneDACA002017 [Acorus gramineus]
MYFKKSEPPPPPLTTSRPWSKLPLSFAKHLLRCLQIPDYIRFSSVCHAWHISKKRAQTLPSQQLPWLLLPRHVDDPSVTFYSLSENRSYRIPTPSIIIGSKCLSAVHGWLLFGPNLSILNPLYPICLELPKNLLFPPTITAAAIIMSPLDPLDFWVFFASGRSIFGWKPNVGDMFKKDQYVTEILDMTADAEKLYYITTELELFEYDHRSDATKPLVVDPPVDDAAPRPSLKNDHFLMMAHVGDEMKILMAVVGYVLNVHNGTTREVDSVELYMPRGGEWVQVEAEECGHPVLFLSYNASSLCITAMEAGGRGGRAYLVPKRERAESISKAQEVEELMWIEIDLVAGGVTYKENKKERSTKKPRMEDRLVFPSPLTTRPWTKLPLRFVGRLLRRLQVPDYIRFGSVCHAWHIAKKRAQTPPSAPVPWLLLPRQTNETSIAFYSVSERCTYHIPSFITPGSECVASFPRNGWLLFESRFPPNSSAPSRTLFLLDPVSQIQYDLPITDVELPEVNAAVITIPSSEDEDIWILIAGGKIIVGWNLGSLIQCRVRLNFNVLEMVAMAGYVYIVTENLRVMEYDLRLNVMMDLVLNVPPLDELPWPSAENDHFVVVAQAFGDWVILMAVVVYYIGCGNKPLAVDRMELYAFCGGVWMRVPPEVIGDQVLFLGCGGSSVCMMAAEAGVRARMAYVVPPKEKVECLSDKVGADLKWVEINLESGEVGWS